MAGGGCLLGSWAKTPCQKQCDDPGVMEISQMQLTALQVNGVSPSEPSPVDYVFMLLTLAAVVLLVASIIVFFRQPNRRWSDVWIVLFLVFIPVVGPLAYLLHVRSRGKRDKRVTSNPPTRR